jgi:hypothetical protein
MATIQDVNAAKRNFYVFKLGLDPMTNMSLNDLEFAFYSDPANWDTGGGGTGGVDLGTATGQLSADKVIDGTTNKAYKATEQTKLSGIATGATSNSSDAFLRARGNHTGFNAIGDTTGLQTALDGKALAGVAGMVPGEGVYCYKVGANWVYAGSNVTTRAAVLGSRTDCVIIFISTDGTMPTFGIANWDVTEGIPA